MSGGLWREILADAFLLLAIVGCCYLILAAALSWRFARRPQTSPAAPEPVSILKPLHGAEPELLARLSSFCAQDYAAQVQYLFGIADQRDPAAKIVEELHRRFPEHDIELVVDARQHGANRKVSNLINMAARARNPVLILADSDIEVDRDYLTRVAAELGWPGVGAVTCLYYSLPAGGFWSRLGGLWIDSQFLPNAIVGISTRLARPCFGSTIALRRETLEAIGGFARIADCLADDHALGAAVRESGRRVTIAPWLVGHSASETTFGQLAAHELRWARTIKGIDPLGYFGTLITYPLPWALLAWAFAAPAGAAVVAVAAALRIGLLWTLEKAFGMPHQPWWLTPIRDLLSFALYVGSFFGSGVRWRDADYEVRGDGTLSEGRRAPLK